YRGEVRKDWQQQQKIAHDEHDLTRKEDRVENQQETECCPQRSRIPPGDDEPYPSHYCEGHGDGRLRRHHDESQILPQVTDVWPKAVYVVGMDAEEENMASGVKMHLEEHIVAETDRVEQGAWRHDEIGAGCNQR